MTAELQPEYADHDQAQADDARDIGRFAQQHHAHDGRTHRADAGPHRVGGAGGQRFMALANSNMLTTIAAMVMMLGVSRVNRGCISDR